MNLTLTEVSPRDGLQNETRIVSTSQKLSLINRLLESGLHHIEVAACVSAERVPQMADSAAVLEGLPERKDAVYSTLVANMRGLETALQHPRSGKIAVFTAASESFTQSNIGCGVDESISKFKPIVQLAKDKDLIVRGYISTAVLCPFEGSISPQKTAEVATKLAEIGCDEIALGDTLGAATPKAIRRMWRETMRAIPQTPLIAHFHDTYGSAIANIASALEEGALGVDASTGGLGGCPFAPGAAGNAATEDVVYFLEKEGITTGVNLDAVINVGEWICRELERPYRVKSGVAVCAAGKKGGANDFKPTS